MTVLKERHAALVVARVSEELLEAWKQDADARYAKAQKDPRLKDMARIHAKIKLLEKERDRIHNAIKKPIEDIAYVQYTGSLSKRGASFVVSKSEAAKIKLAAVEAILLGKFRTVDELVDHLVKANV